MNKYYYILIGIILTISGTVFAYPYYNFSQTIVPSINNAWDLGSTSPDLEWRNIYTKNLTVTGNCSGCGGGGGTFPFTSSVGYNSTSTTIGFLNGLFSTASSTFLGPLFLPSLNQGFVYTGTNGGVNSIASSSIKLSWFNNDSGFTTNTGTVTQISVSPPLTGGVITTTGSIGCQTATIGTNGCLTSSDWFTFFSKLGSYDASTHPFQGQSATTSLMIFNGGATSTDISSNVAQFGATGTTSIDTIGRITFPYSTSTIYSSFFSASSTLHSIGTLTLPNLGTAAGSFIAVDPTGKVIATTTPSGGGGGGSGTVTAVSVVTANGISGSVANPNTTPAITLSLGAITPSSVTSSGTVSGTNLTAYHVSRNLGGNLGDTIQIGGFQTGNGDNAVIMGVTCDTGGYTTAKTYSITDNYGNSGTYKLAVPLSDSGPFTPGGESFDVDGKEPGDTLILRIRKTVSTGSAPTCNVQMFDVGNPSVFTPDSTTGSGASVPTQVLPGARIANLSNLDINFGSYNFNNWNSTGLPIQTYFSSSGTNGGSTPSAPFPALVLTDPGVAGQAYGNIAEFNLSRYANVSTDAKTQLDFALTDGSSANKGTTIMSLQSGGNVGIGTTTPDSNIDVNGSVRFEGNSSFVTASISGAIIGLGCDSVTTTLGFNLASTTAFVTTPQSYPGAGLTWSSYLLAVNKVVTQVCSDVTVTPSASIYNVKILK